MWRARLERLGRKPVLSHSALFSFSPQSKVNNIWSLEGETATIARISEMRPCPCLTFDFEFLAILDSRLFAFIRGWTGVALVCASNQQLRARSWFFSVLPRQLHKQILQRPPDRVHSNHLSACQPDLLDSAALSQCRYGDLDKPVLLRAVKHQRIDSPSSDDEAVLRLKQLCYCTNPGHASFDHNGHAITNLLDLR